MTGRRLGAFSVLMAAVLWSTAGLFMGLLGDLDPWTILFWRSLFGAAITAAMAFPEPRRRRGATGSLRWWWVAVVASAVGMIAFIPALRLTSVANVALIHAALPVFAAMASFLIQAERPSRATALSSFVSLAGAAVIFASSSTAEAARSGDLLALVMTISIALMTVALRLYDGPVRSVVAASNGIAAIAAYFISSDITIDIGQAVLLAAFASIQMVLGLILYSKGAQLLPSAQTALLSLAEVPLSPLWVWLAFGEQPTPACVVGGLIILAATVSHGVLHLYRNTGEGLPMRQISKGAP